jgi:hypothetical protein
MHRFVKRLVVFVMLICIVPSAAFADRLVDGVPIPDDAKVVLPSAAVPEMSAYPLYRSKFVGALDRTRFSLARSLDDFVGGAEQRERHEPERLTQLSHCCQLQFFSER